MAYNPSQLGPGVEFDAIRRILARLGNRSHGIGDDAALLANGLCVSTDTSLEGVHFKQGWLSPEEIGWRATAAALSDLSAMGARPSAVLLALLLPERWEADIDSMTEGVGAAASTAGAMVAGGDITRSERLGLVVTVLGTAERPLRRSGVKAGDLIAVTGALGGPLLALRSFLAGVEPSCSARERFARPWPRLEAGVAFAASGVHAAIDISDGLASDLAHLAAASDVTIELDLESVPCVDGASPLDAVASGEEYELAIALVPETDITSLARETSTPITVVGRAVSGPPGVIARDRTGVVDLPSGHDHLSR